MDARTITHTTRSQDKIRFADALVASELETALDGVLVLKTARSAATYNRQFAEMWAMPNATREQEVDKIVSHVRAQLKAPAGFSVDIRHFRVHPDKQVYWELELIDGRIVVCHSGAIQGAPEQYLGCILFFRDVTTERASQAALRASHALLATTERIAHIGGWDWDLVHDVLAWSDEACRMFGRDPRTYVPTLSDFESSVHPDDRPRVKDAIAASLNHNEPYDLEFRIVRPDRSERIIHAQAEITLDENGKAARMTGTTHDITVQKTIERELRFANALFVAQIEGSPDGILVVGANRRIVSFNQKFVELWALPNDVVQSRSDERAAAWVLGSLKDPAAFLSRLEELYAHPQEHSHEELELNDGRVFERHSGPLPIVADTDPGRIFFFRDISARKSAEDNAVRMARQDGLTRLANRNVFVESLQRAIAHKRRDGNGFALLYLDLDHFKDINDTLGHPVGDLLLKAVAERLRATVREPDLLARFGGDEFAVIESDVTDPSDVATLAERLLGALRAPFLLLGSEVRIGASIGIAIHTQDISGPEVLLSHADLALYRAKADGRGTYRFFAEGMDAEAHARVALVSDLREAIGTDQMLLVYQPQVEIATGRIVGLEALVRWRHPRRGMVGPAEFIPVAERSGLMVSLGRWVMRSACRQAKLWIDAGIGPAIVAINVSGSQFRTPFELETTLAAILAETRLVPDRLELELTESVLMDAWFEQRDVLLHLRELGIKIAIDDFGTGFSSLQYLSRFPVDRIKIAQGFIRDLGDGPRNTAVVRATIGLARELGLQVIAEGVETPEQFALLRDWGCREVQGYYFAKPLPEDEIAPLLRKGTLSPRASRLPATTRLGFTRSA